MLVDEILQMPYEALTAEQRSAFERAADLHGLTPDLAYKLALFGIELRAMFRRMDKELETCDSRNTELMDEIRMCVKALPRDLEDAMARMN